ncbi:hypothetical protein ILUMI_04406 [Ignelater luminosus]|uniref:Cytochrome P450 n=1 Tax=Ignelater luminosus TaxID=2038154 RepID=A0A8K0DEU3_IGNLU|nr:hypothetical protein ILUMI_04406 [Ignelater luminosus]
MLIYIIGTTLLVFGFYIWLRKNDDYWKKKGVNFLAPRLFVGNMGEMILMKKSIGAIVTEFYKNAQGLPYLGIFNMRQPVLLLRDTSVIRNVLVSEFNKFRDNGIELSEEADPILAKNPFFLKGDRWKIVRAQLTPLLTNAKIKAMFPLVQDVCKNMVNYLEREPDANEEHGLEAKELALKFTSDNVASCAFGLEEHSFNDPNAEFRKMAEQFLKPTWFGYISFFITTLFPSLIKMLKIPNSQRHISDKFKEILTKTVKYRKNNNIRRNDYLDSLIELKSKPMPYEYTDDYMVAHAFTFFLDGSETSAIILSFALFEIAADFSIENKLKNEIDEMLIKYNGVITFEAVQEMTYLDAIFSETLRKYPPLMVMTRECTEEAKLVAPDNPGQEFKIEKGCHIYIPVLGMHHDPQYYPDPETFDPDRFTENAKHALPKNCFFGFGDGPRTCLGRRFANMQIKLGIISIVRNFEIRVNYKTKVPVEIATDFFLLGARGGLWLNFYKRKNETTSN